MKTKISLSVLLLLLINISGISQPSKHSFLLSGNIDFAHTKTSEDGSRGQQNVTQNSFSILPQAGYFIFDRFMIGASIEYSYLKSVGTTSITLIPSGFMQTNLSLLTRGFTPGIFVKYFLPITEKFFFAGKLGFSYGFQGSQILRIGESETSQTFWESFDGERVATVSLSPELIYFLTQKVGLQVTYDCLSFKSTRTETVAENSTTNEFDFDLKPSNLSLGVVVIL